ncbi:MAG TPA: cyclic nucleotide-binding domain-containing protein [Myxococcota bacterium]|nr:cyclic nucleotide-binding domain-containing protein [Myxococcota bacterium]
MSTDVATLRKQVDQALTERRPADAVCYLAELVATHPDDRTARTALAITLGDAGHPAGALKVLRALADRLAHGGFLLPAMVVVRHGLEHAPSDPCLLSTLKRLHVRGVRAKAHMPSPPALKAQKTAHETATAAALLALSGQERLERATQIGTDFPPAGDAAVPLPMPLFSELDPDSFLEVVARLRYQRFPKGHRLLQEGQSGDTLLVIASGNVVVEKGGNKVARLGSGTVLGEMALITGAPRSATAIADEEVEVFELARGDVEQMAKAKPQIAEELIAYCCKRLINNLLQTSPLFKRFDDATRLSLVDRFTRAGFQPGQPLIEQGKVGTGLYVIVTGDVQVTSSNDGDTTVLANLGPGDVVGEIALLKEQPTTANVVAASRVGALFLPKADFQLVLNEHQEVKDYLESLSADRLQANSNVGQVEEILDADELIVL